MVIKMKIYKIWESNTNQYVNNHNGFYEFVPATSYKSIDVYNYKIAKTIIKIMTQVDNIIVESLPNTAKAKHDYVMQEITLDQIHLTDHELSEIIKGALERGENPVSAIDQTRMKRAQTKV